MISGNALTNSILRTVKGYMSVHRTVIMYVQICNWWLSIPQSIGTCSYPKLAQSVSGTRRMRHVFVPLWTCLDKLASAKRYWQQDVSPFDGLKIVFAAQTCRCLNFLKQTNRTA